MKKNMVAAAVGAMVAFASFAPFATVLTEEQAAAMSSERERVERQVKDELAQLSQGETPMDVSYSLLRYDPMRNVLVVKDMVITSEDPENTLSVRIDSFTSTHFPDEGVIFIPDSSFARVRGVHIDATSDSWKDVKAESPALYSALVGDDGTLDFDIDMHSEVVNNTDLSGDMMFNVANVGDLSFAFKAAGIVDKMQGQPSDSPNLPMQVMYSLNLADLSMSFTTHGLAALFDAGVKDSNQSRGDVLAYIESQLHDAAASYRSSHPQIAAWAKQADDVLIKALKEGEDISYSLSLHNLNVATVMPLLAIQDPAEVAEYVLSTFSVDVKTQIAK